MSEAELEISDDHEGIIDLPEDAPLGAPFAAYAGLDDAVIEINLTPNRPDAASVARHRPRSRGRGLGRLQGPADRAGEGQLSVPGRR